MTETTANLDSLLKQSGWLAKLARSLVKDAAEADDLVQEVWLSALKNPPAVGKERAWLRMVVRNRFVDSLRSKRPTEPMVEEPRDSSAFMSDAASNTVDAHVLLGRALEKLPDPYRTVIVSRYFHGMTPQEIAAASGLESATVRTQLSRGRSKMRSLLEGEFGMERSAWALLLMPLALRDPSVTTTAVSTSSFAGLSQVWKIAIQPKFLLALGVVFASFILNLAVNVDEDDLGHLNSEVSELELTSNSTTPQRVQELYSGRDSEGDQGTSAIVVASQFESKQVLLRFTDPDGKALSDAHVIIYRDEDIILDARTGVAGGVSVPKQSEECSYAVLAEGWPCTHGRVSLQSEATVSMKRGREHSGRVTFVSDLPHRDLTLFMRTKIEHGLPPQIYDLLKIHTNAMSQIMYAKVSPEGFYKFQGLPDDTWIVIYLSAGFRTVKRRPFFGYSAPQKLADFSVNLKPRIIGRIVRKGTNVPIPDCRLWVTSKRIGSMATTDKSGNFVVDFFSNDVEDLKLMVNQGGRVVVIHEFEGLLYDTIDIGDFELALEPRWRFKVLDRRNRPIKGAVVLRNHKVVGVPTGADGLGVIPEMSGTIEYVHVGAPGLGSKKVKVVHNSDRRQEIIIDPLTELTLNLHGFPSIINEYFVCLESKSKLTLDDFDRELEYSYSAGNMWWNEDRGNDSGSRLILKFAASDELYLHSLRPNIPFNVTLSTKGGAVLYEKKGVVVNTGRKEILKVNFDEDNTWLFRLEIKTEDSRKFLNATITNLGGEAFSNGKLTVQSNDMQFYIRRKSKNKKGIRISMEGYHDVEVDEPDLKNKVIPIFLRQRN